MAPETPSLGLFWVAGCVWLSACSRPDPQRALSPEWVAARAQIPLYEAQGYHTEWIDSSGQRYFLLAGQVRRIRRSDTLLWELQNPVHLFHLSAAGETLQTLTSQKAYIYLERDLFIAEERVLLRTAEGLRLETDYLFWQRGQSRLEAPGWVRIQTPKETLRGEGLAYDLEKRTYRLRRSRGSLPSPAP